MLPKTFMSALGIERPPAASVPIVSWAIMPEAEPAWHRGIRGCEELLEDPHVRHFLQVAGLTVGGASPHPPSTDRKVPRAHIRPDTPEYTPASVDWPRARAAVSIKAVAGPVWELTRTTMMAIGTRACEARQLLPAGRQILSKQQCRRVPTTTCRRGLITWCWHTAMH